ncbi:MAG: DNA-deoxyinosine glycosylase [Sideroxydans sp.]|nr:DNA-deoxyinosine glycosylase [Sideroxyarcus sp.]
MTRIRSFPPVGDEHATVLILGSMPGKESLRQQQYYAHPANAFWKIMGEIVGAYPAMPYEDRLDTLRSSGIALWDVLASCARKSSLDSHIRNEKANDFASFFATHPHVMRVYFNGAKAEQSFNKFVLAKQTLPPLTFQRLPSTSPAHADMRYEEKLELWKAIIGTSP